MPRQELKFKLSSDGRKLIMWSVKRNGALGKPYVWQIRGRSYIPARPFYLIKEFVHTLMRKCADKTDFTALRKAALRGLCQAAQACGCEAVVGTEGVDCLWYLEGSPFFAFQVDALVTKKQRLRKLLASKAVFRWTILLESGSRFRIKPRPTRIRTEATED